MFIRGNGGGGDKYKMEMAISTSSSSVEIDCGFKPKKIILACMYSTNWLFVNVYDEDVSNSKYKQYTMHNDISIVRIQDINMPVTGGTTGILNITSNGFIVSGSTNNICYIAIG